MNYKEQVELNKKLYKFCGINCDCDWSILPELATSLDAQAIFIYPKLRTLGYTIQLNYNGNNEDANVVNIANLNGLKPQSFYAKHIILPIAFALATEKLIDSMGK